MASQCYVIYSPTDSMNGYLTWLTWSSLPLVVVIIKLASDKQCERE